LEEALSEELLELGARQPEVVKGGVLFDASPTTARKMVLWSRVAVRILEPVSVGEVTTFDELYEWAKLAPWEELIGKQRTFAVQARLTGSELTDTRFASLRVKDAIVDRIRDRQGSRPNVDRESPAVPVRLIVRGTRALLFRDLAGESLHRRGYRPILVKSPLSEGIAAGLLRMTGWTGETPLLDPMCGSGTFVIEAAMMAAGRAPAISRKLAAERFPDSDARLWTRLREEARDVVKPSLDFPILGADRHSGALQIARGAAKKANLDHLVEFRSGDALHYEPPFEPSLVVTNPPWGERLGEGDDLVDSWRALGTFLRRCPGALAYVLCGTAELTRNLGLKADSRAPVRIGPHDVRWLRYEIRARREAEERTEDTTS